MKLRIYPKKEVVLGLLNEERERAIGRISDAEKSLQEMKESESKLVTDPFGSKRALMETELQYGKEDLKDATDKILLVESHGPSEVQLEIEV